MWYLYLFQALPVEIDQKEISVIDKIISRFQIHYNFLKSKARLYQTLKLIFMQLKSSFLLMCCSKFHARWKDIKLLTITDLPTQAILAHMNLDCIKEVQQLKKMRLS